jgi:hypothetical protein
MQLEFGRVHRDVQPGNSNMKNAKLLALLALLLGGCASGGPPPPLPADPVAQGHAAWCWQVPPSPYCTISEPDP